MTWREIMRLDLGALLRGKREVVPTGKRSRPVGRWFTRSPLIDLTRCLHRLVKCNAPLAAGIAGLAADSPLALWRVLRRLSTSLDQGLPLSEAMAREPRTFPRYYVDIIRAAESSGTLEAALQGLIEHLENRRRLKGAWQRPFLYFVGVGMSCLAISVFLTIKVLPIFAQIAADFGSQLPAPLRFFMRAWDSGAGIGAVAVLLVVAAFLYWFLRPLWNRRARSPLFIVPGLRRLVIWSNLSHASDIMARLIKAGYPMDEAIDALAGADLAGPFLAMFRRVKDRVRQGNSLFKSLESERNWAPPSYLVAVMRGETSGELAQTLGEAADYYCRQMLKVGHLAASVAFPILVATIGTWVFFIVTFAFATYTSILDTVG